MRRAIPHPLLSTTLGNLLRCFEEYGWPEARFAVRAASLLTICSLRTPLHHLEQWRVRARVESQAFIAPPLFVIGHWRSGTTHLHRLLCQDPQFGFITLMQAAFPLDFLTSVAEPLLAVLLPPTRQVDAMTIMTDSPWEEEMALACLCPLSFFHSFYFPRNARRIYRAAVHFDGVAPNEVHAWWRDYRYFLQKVQSTQPFRRLVIKNPANSARVAALREQFPGAKFIHIHRHPERVFASTLLLHREAQAAWGLQKSDATELPEIVLANYDDLITACFAQTESLPAHELIEIGLSDLEIDPIGTLRRIYVQLQIDEFEAAAPIFQNYLREIGPFAQNRLQLGENERSAVRERLARVYERYGYD
jgi:hypothetical protein